ncbi:MAG: M1 family metallopeptidase [Lewinellaceae bacterium]|nr:M1 family metallopeptidase [Lewinellaceae bacterium]
MRKKLALLFTFSVFTAALTAQPTFTRQDTLRGAITPERAWWDLAYYHLDISVNPGDSTIRGSNTIQYRVLKPGQQLMQIDLQPPMKIEKVVQKGEELPFRQDGNAWFIELGHAPQQGATERLTVHFGGRPRIARRPPWDAALTWTLDNNGNPFAATSCQGDGASLWWPCKDHMYDEPDSMLISVRVPDSLMDVSNGRLRKVEENGDGTKTFHWFVNNPINNYGVNVNIGDYVHFSEKYEGEKGELDCDYYVLPYNLEKARAQFRDVPRMLEAFEYWFGPYPFYEDGFKLVEVPYLGMEHQSSVTYGNRYGNGYLGRDLSGTGWGLKFDFIIIHESGHEWFANSITYQDIADMWVHEGFTAYSENLFLDYHYGKEASSAYVIGTRANIRNDRPIIGAYGVNNRGSGDMYPKAANMLHTLRQAVNDDEKWRSILRGLNQEFYHQTVSSRQVEDYISRHTGRDLSAFFDQYLRTTQVPRLEYRIEGKALSYRWANCVEGFDMPVRVFLNEKEQWLQPVAGQWKEERIKGEESSFTLDNNFYVTLKMAE